MKIKIKKTYAGHTRLKYQNKRINELRYHITNKKPITRKRLRKFLAKTLKEMPNKDDMMIMVNAKFGDRNRSGKFTDIEPQDLDIFDPSYYGVDNNFDDKIYAFSLYLREKVKPSKEGGQTELNDCLYRCLYKAFAGNIPNMKFANSLKKYLNLERNEKVHIDLIPKLEEKLRTRINVSGDHDYISTKDHTRRIDLKLTDGHYTLLQHRSKKLIQAIAHEEKQPLFYFYDNKGIYHIYNGDDFSEIELDTYITMKADIRKNPRTTSHFLLPAKSKETMEQEYNAFVKDADDIRDKTKGLVNIYKCQGKYTMAIRRLFFNYSRCFECEGITEHESKYIDKAFMGGLIWGHKKVHLEDAYCYDFNSMYSHVMCSYSFPLQEGKFHRLDILEDSIKYGIYRCNVSNADKRLFKTNKFNFYTHIDLKRARELKYDIELIHDEQPNALIYQSGKVYGTQLFKPTIDQLYPHKGTTPAIKKLLALFWGSLVKRWTYLVNTKDKDVNIKDGREMIFITRRKDYHLVKCQRTNNRYEFDYARVAPFITAQARYLVSKQMEEHIDSIHRCHTDGFIADKKLSIPLSRDLGKIKLEKQGKCYIHHSMKVDWA